MQLILPEFNFIFYWVGGFALFAFLTNLTREIIKDIEDFEGDIAYGRNTVPVVIGILSAKIVSIMPDNCNYHSCSILPGTFLLMI